MRILQAFAPAAMVLLLSGCAADYTAKPAKAPEVPLAETAPATYVRPCPTPPSTPAEAFECDRKSILAMAGEFRVRFAFDETAALAPGYTPHAAQRSGGTEVVDVIADSGEQISLQHILVLGKEHTVVKHWRQDWHYQPTRILRFRGNGRFETETVDAAQARGAWSQTVYEVDDAPRYAGIARWTHAHDGDAWQSDRTWRPLPRREYTKRTDYQALEVTNRHTLTPAGWIQEQDNTKLIVGPDGSTQALAREVGVNSYTRIHDYDFTAGRDYWNRTSAFWTDVRAEWDRIAATLPAFTTTPEPNGEPRIEAFFKLAERAEKGEKITVGEIKQVFDQYVNVTSSKVVATTRP
jgi:hypothetical protein